MKLTKVFAALVFLGATASASFAQVATHDVTIVVPVFNLFDVSGNVTRTLGAPVTAGNDPTPAVDNSSQYLVTTNETGKKITASLSSAYTTGITLEAELSAVGSSTSAGKLQLTAVAQDFVTGIGLVSGFGSIEYTASATAAVAPNAPSGETRTVTYTLTS
jgi:hypothetical protein